MRSHEHLLPSGERVCVTFLSDDILRFQMAPAGEPFRDSALNRYGFVSPSNGKRFGAAFARGDQGFTGETAAVRLKFREDTRVLRIIEKVNGTVVFRQTTATLPGGEGGAGYVACEAAEEEDWVGFGDQTRERLFHRGHRADCWVLNVKSYIPVPFFMSTRGVGILVNSTHRVRFDMAASQHNVYSWEDPRGVVDYYVFVGTSFKDLLAKYTSVAGRPKLPPAWAFGLWYICRTQANDYEAVQDALNFRREQIPCDVIGLEPGWMERHYDATTEKAWSKERFPIPPWAPNGPDNFIDVIKRMGYHFELWLCNTYDLSYEADRRASAAERAAADAEPEAESAAGAEQDENLGLVHRMDRVTKPEEPWFDHLKKFVDQGVDFFKQDGNEQVDVHPDRLYGNGMGDKEMHNLYPLLYAKQMYEGFAEYTGRRPVVFTPAGWAGFQAWCGTWTGDVGGGPGTLCSMLNTSLVGHSWCTNDMEVHSKEGMHFGYLQPWAQINSWTYFRMPWVQGEELLACHRFYARLRSRLVPYLYSWAYQATQTGQPLLAPLPLEFPDDPACRAVRNAYLLGRDMLVVAFAPEVYLPRGRWRDFWTGEVAEGGQTTRIGWPADRGGGLFLREGAIVPLGPVMQYRGEKPLDAFEVHVFPAEGPTEFALYDDDGVSFDHLNGDYALTTLRICGRESVRIEVSAPEGRYAHRLPQRTWRLVVAGQDMPKRVRLDGADLPANRWRFDEDRRELEVDGLEAPFRLEIS